MIREAHRSGRALAVLALVFAAASAPATIHGQASEKRTKVIMLTGGGSASRVEQLSQAIAAQLSDLEVIHQVIETTEIPQGSQDRIDSARAASHLHGASVIFWLAAEETPHLIIYLDEHDPPLITRRLSDAGEGVLLDTAAIILRGVIRAYLAGEQLPSESPPTSDDGAPAPAEEEPVAPETPAPASVFPVAEDLDLIDSAPPSALEDHRLWAEAGYTARTHSPQSPFLHGLGLGVGAAITAGVRVVASYEFITPATRHTQDLDLSLEIHPITLAVQMQLPAGPFALGGRIGPRMAVVKEEVTARGDLNEAGGRWELEWAAHLSVEVTYPITQIFSVYWDLGADLIINKTEYAIDMVDEDPTVIDPWRVSALARLGLRASFM